MPKKKPTDRQKKRERRLYLSKVAKELCDWLDERIESHEGCAVRRIAEGMWDVEEQPPAYASILTDSTSGSSNVVGTIVAGGGGVTTSA